MIVVCIVTKGILGLESELLRDMRLDLLLLLYLVETRVCVHVDALTARA